MNEFERLRESSVWELVENYSFVWIGSIISIDSGYSKDIKRGSGKVEKEKWKSGKTHSVSFINERESGLIRDYPNSNEGIPSLK